MSSPKIVYNSNLPPFFGVDGITLYPFIFIRLPEGDANAPELLRHEMVHINQIKEVGVIKFYLTYIYYSIRYGYKNNPYEVEAYTKQKLDN